MCFYLGLGLESPGANSLVFGMSIKSFALASIGPPLVDGGICPQISWFLG